MIRSLTYIGLVAVQIIYICEVSLWAILILDSFGTKIIDRNELGM